MARPISTIWKVTADVTEAQKNLDKLGNASITSNAKVVEAAGKVKAATDALTAAATRQERAQARAALKAEQGHLKAARAAAQHAKETEKAARAELKQKEELAKRFGAGSTNDLLGGRLSGLANLSKGGAIAAGVAGLGAMTAELISVSVKGAQAIDTIATLAESTGTSTESFTRLSYAASLSNVSQDQLQSSMEKLGRSMVQAQTGTGAAAKAFDKMGIDVRAAGGGLKNIDEVLLEVANAFNRIDSAAEKQGLARALRFDPAMVAFLNQGAMAIDAMGREADELGIVLRSNTIEAARRLDDNVTKLNKISDAWAMTLAGETAPALNDLVEMVIKAEREHGTLSMAATGVGAAFRVAATGVQVMGFGIDAILPDVGALTDGLRQLGIVARDVPSDLVNEGLRERVLKAGESTPLGPPDSSLADDLTSKSSKKAAKDWGQSLQEAQRERETARKKDLEDARQHATKTEREFAAALNRLNRAAETENAKRTGDVFEVHGEQMERYFDSYRDNLDRKNTHLKMADDIEQEELKRMEDARRDALEANKRDVAEAAHYIEHTAMNVVGIAVESFGQIGEVIDGQLVTAHDAVANFFKGLIEMFAQQVAAYLISKAAQWVAEKIFGTSEVNLNAAVAGSAAAAQVAGIPIVGPALAAGTAAATAGSVLAAVSPFMLAAEGAIVPANWPGAVRGKDSVPAMLMPGERVLSLSQVSMLGGHQTIDRLLGMRSGLPNFAGPGPLHFAGGGVVPHMSSGNVTHVYPQSPRMDVNFTINALATPDRSQMRQIWKSSILPLERDLRRRGYA